MIDRFVSSVHQLLCKEAKKEGSDFSKKYYYVRVFAPQIDKGGKLCPTHKLFRSKWSK
jgi:hypothetical protein